jgi:hypothetical protein
LGSAFVGRSENGVVFVEVYKAESQQENKLINLFARYQVEICLFDPVLEVFVSNGLLIASNNDWNWELNPVFEKFGAFPLSGGSTDAVLVLMLAANATYTAIASGSNNTTGEALVEVYEIE